jgi:hypothetical protein
MVMRFALILVAVSAAPAQILSISPAVITQCTNGLGRATLSWNSPLNTQVQIRVLARDGTPMTGLEPPNGSAQTEDWVRDGMAFFLVTPDDVVIDQVTARVNCSGTPDTTTAAFTALPIYFPMQAGNRWVFRTNSRIETSGYTTWIFTRTEQIAGQTWFILETRFGGSSDFAETAYRAADNGQVYRMPGYPSDTHEELWLDPNGGPLSSAVLKTQSVGVPVNTPFGELPGLQYQSYGSLTLETGTFVEGLGLLTSSTDMITGSSGGFTFGLDLVEARIGQAIYYTTPSLSVSVAAENSVLDVTNKKVTNCAVPCYFAACGLAPGSDPPGTWKPCFQARVRASLPPAMTLPLDAELDLVNSSGVAVYQQALGLSAVAPAGEATAYVQIPLFSAPNIPFPPGNYSVNVTVHQAGTAAGSASVPVTVQ